jgi:uncharacterized protein YcgL (UPF0745 family)
MTKKVTKQKLSKMLFIILALISLSTTAKSQSTFLDAHSAQKDELKITPEITKVLKSDICMFFKNVPDEILNNYGIKNMSQLLNLQLGKPIPMYVIDNQNLAFTGFWRLPILSDDEFIALATVKLADNEQYEIVDFGAVKLAKILNNYEHKNLIIGILRVYKQNADYLYIQKNNQDIFVKMSDLNGKKYSLSDIINIIEKI